MGKPVIITTDPTLPIDVEKEGIGFAIEYGDREGWQRAIQFLVDHPEEAAAMGERALWLAKHKYNYRIFGKELTGFIDTFFNKAKPVSAKVYEAVQ